MRQLPDRWQMLARQGLGYFDWVLVAAMVAATGLGLLMLYSTTSLQGGAQFYRQLMWLGIALTGFLIVVSIDYRFWASLAIPAYAISCVTLVVVLVQARAGNLVARFKQRWRIGKLSRSLAPNSSRCSLAIAHSLSWASGMEPAAGSAAIAMRT